MATLRIYDLERLWTELRATNDLWHTTTLTGLASIISDGVIKPNDGTNPSPRPSSHRSHARQLTAVSLFDFTQAEFINDVTQHFLDDYFPERIFIRVKRDRLNPELLLTPDAVMELGHDYLFVPYLEALYRGPIPTNCIGGFACFHFVASDEFLWAEVPFTDDPIELLGATVAAQDEFASRRG